MKRSILRISLGSMNSSGRNPFTSAANRVGKAEASKRVMGPTPDRPARTASQVGLTPMPRGVTAPRPVTTTRLAPFLDTGDATPTWPAP